MFVPAPTRDPTKRCMVLSASARNRPGKRRAWMLRSWHARAGAARKCCSRESSFSSPPETPLQDPRLPPFISRRIALARVTTASSASCEGVLVVTFSDVGPPRLSRFRTVFNISLVLSVRAQARASRDPLWLGSVGIAFSPSCLTFRSSSFARRKESVPEPQGSEPFNCGVSLSLSSRLAHGLAAFWAA